MRSREIPDDAPRWTETIDLQLTFSRDGRNWHRGGNRQTFLAPADPGGEVFDASMVFALHQPFVKDDRIWIYYLGCPDRDTHLEYKRKGLGWATESDFEKNLEETIKWYKDNEDWWVPLKKKAEIIEW